MELKGFQQSVGEETETPAVFVTSVGQTTSAEDNTCFIVGERCLATRLTASAWAPAIPTDAVAESSKPEF